MDSTSIDRKLEALKVVYPQQIKKKNKLTFNKPYVLIQINEKKDIDNNYKLIKIY